MKKLALLNVLSVFSALLFALFSPIVADASSEHVHPSDLSFETLMASESNSIFSMVYYEDNLLPIVARSIGRGAQSANVNDVPVLAAYADLSEDAKEATEISWLLPPEFGGAVDSQNTVISTKDTQEVVRDILSQVGTYMGLHADMYMDVQVVPVFSATEDIMPTYLFIGYRALDNNGVPHAIPDVSSGHELAGTLFTGGSGYQYLAVKNGTVGESFNYGSAEHARSEKNEGFGLTFDPVDYFGDESIAVNDDSVAEYTEEDLPPGSSPVFLEHNSSGINSMEVGVAQANGESTSADSNSWMMAFLPIVILGAILLIAMGN